MSDLRDREIEAFRALQKSRDDAQQAARELLDRMCLMAEERNPPVKASAFREPWERLYPWLRRTNGGD